MPTETWPRTSPLSSSTASRQLATAESAARACGRTAAPAAVEPNRAGRAVQQGLAEFPLELADLGAHPGLGDVQPGCGAGEAGFLGHRHQVLQLPQFHNQ